MDCIIGNLFGHKNSLFYEYKDPRTRDWMFSSPIWILVIISSYLYFCLKAGPRYMEGRKPYSLKNVIIVYNLFQVIYSILLFFGATRATWVRKYNFLCEPLDYSDDRGAVLLLDMAWYYFFGKITELLDTVFFVLRKKQKQVTFLHVFHHTIMAFFIWAGFNFFGGGHAFLFGYLNSFVHIIMYTYYLLAALGPKYQKYLWWKKHMTMIQLVQFVIIVIHNLIPFFNNCNYPRSINVLIISFDFTFIYMFGKFYVQNYLKHSREREEKLKLERAANEEGREKTGVSLVAASAKRKLDKGL